jgi:hypothetical protein
MTLVQRKFAAGLITLFIVSLTSYTGQATKLTQVACNADSNLATQIRTCLETNGIVIEKLNITNDSIEVVVKADANTPSACYVIEAGYKCVRDAVAARNAVCTMRTYVLTISIVSSTPGVPPQLEYKGHVGTASDPDTIRICNDVQAKTMSVKSCKVERAVVEDAKRLGIMIDNLDLKAKKCEGDDKDKLCIQVSGKVRAPEGSEPQVRGKITSLVNKHTGVRLRYIKIDNLKVLPPNKPKAPPQSGKDSSIK